jgi:hypothetical protein
MMLAAIDFHSLGQVIWVSALASVGETVLFSIVIYSSGKAGEARRGGQGGAATAYVALASLAGLVFAASVIVGVAVMLSK